MKAVILKAYGGPEVMTVADIDAPSPRDHELLIRVKATTVNRADTLQRKGKYPPPEGESTIMGLDVAGEVVSWGANVSEFKKGDRVFGLVAGGGYAEFACIDAQMAMKIPESMDFITAAAIPETFITANETVIELGQLQKGQTILIHAAGSGVGTAALQLARSIGAEIFITAGSQEKINKLLTLGAQAGFNYKTDDFVTGILEKTQQKGVDVIEDFGGASFLAKNLSILKEGGRLLLLALMGGNRAEIDLAPIIAKRLCLQGFKLRSRSVEEKKIFTQLFLKRWMPKFNTGELAPLIDSTFTLEDIVKAHQHMEANLNFGKIVVVI
jgi:tumor protein p53-inducible protein 3